MAGRGLGFHWNYCAGRAKTNSVLLAGGDDARRVGRRLLYAGIASPFTHTHRASGVAVIPIAEPDAHLDARIAWKKGETSRAVGESIRSARTVFPANVHTARSGAA